VLTAKQLHERAMRANEHGRHAEARRTLRQALVRADGPELRARILLSLGYQEAERGHVDEGLVMLDQADVPGLSAEVLGLLASQRGLLLMRAGREGEALVAFDEALRLLDESNPLAITRAALNRGDVHLQRQDLAAARADFERAVEVARRHGYDVQAAMATHNLGYVDLLAGDLPSALRHIDEVAPQFEAMSVAHAAVSHGDRAQVLMAAGLWTEADADLTAAATAFGLRRMRQSQAETELARARLALAQDDYVKAERLARQARTRFARRGSESWTLQADLVRLAARAAAGRTPDATHREACALATELADRKLTDDSRTAWLVAARALARSGDAKGAQELLTDHRLPAGAPIATRLLAFTVRSEIAEAAKDRRAVFEAARRGLRELQQWQASFGGLDLQSGLSGHGRKLARKALDLAVDSGRPELVFLWAQRARALVSRLPPVTPPKDARARDLLAELRQLRATPPSEDGAAAVRARCRVLEKQIRQRSWHSQGPGRVADEVSLAQLQSELARADGVLVAHVIAHQTVHALVVTPSSCHLQPLGSSPAAADLMHRVRADLDAAASALAPRELVPVFRASLRQSLDDLAAMLWEPIAERAGAGPVLLVPAGGYAGLPWTMLPGLAGRPLSVARSVSSWFASRSQRTVERVGVVAGPQVPRAVEEAQRVDRVWPAASVLTGEEARTDVVAALAQRVDLLHVAAHGSHDVDNPLFANLRLADGPWFGHDIAGLEALPRHVVLSACELGLSTVRWGDETLGMTAAWLHAGATSVISAVADVSDSTACDVLAEVHQGLVEGLLPAEALARATAGRDVDDPVPFVCFGAGW